MSGKCFELTVKRCQGRTQIMRDARHHFPVCVALLLFPRALFPQPFGHVLERAFYRLHFVTLLHRDDVADARGTGFVLAEAAHAVRDAMQGPGQPMECDDPARHGEQQPQRGRERSALPDALQAGLTGNKRARLTVEHDVEVTGRLRVAGSRCKHRNAENAGQAGVHRIGAEQRQGRAFEKLPDRRQIDLRLPHHAGLADVMGDASVGVQHIDLNTRIDDHQHRQQGFAGRPVGSVRIGPCNLRPVFDDVTGQPVRQALQRLLFVLGRDLPSEQADECAVGEQQHRHGDDEACREGGRTDHGTVSSKR